MEFQRPLLSGLLRRLREPRRFIQVVSGPRQVGKTTLMQQIESSHQAPVFYCTGDESPQLGAGAWLDLQWEDARRVVRDQKKEAILIIDEVHKIHEWSLVVKRNWDQDSRKKVALKVVLSGSAQLLVHKGLTESLTGRFETLYAPQWSFNEMQQAFGFTLDQYIWFGGYPGGAALIHDENRWKAYIRDSIIRTSVSVDILQLTRVHKPALLAQLFDLACVYSGQIVSLQKLTGSLQDAGNVTTLASYLNLLSAAGFVTGITKYSGRAVVQRNSPPKMQVHDNALMTALLPDRMEEAFADRSLKGRLIESSIGSMLIHYCRNNSTALHYWRESGQELDFILKKGRQLTAVEVKSGKEQPDYRIMERFKSFYPHSRLLLLRGQSESDWDPERLAE